MRAHPDGYSHHPLYVHRTAPCSQPADPSSAAQSHGPQPSASQWHNLDSSPHAHAHAHAQAHSQAHADAHDHAHGQAHGQASSTRVSAIELCNAIGGGGRGSCGCNVCGTSGRGGIGGSGGSGGSSSSSDSCGSVIDSFGCGRNAKLSEGWVD